MLGKPRIRGTRITVEHILRECANGLSPEAFSDLYPGVTADDVRAALVFAADYMSHEVILAAE